MPVAAVICAGSPVVSSGVHHHDFRHHSGMKDYDLALLGFVGDDRGPAEFRAGSGSCGNGDHGHKAGGDRALPVVADILQVPYRDGLARHQGDGLGCIKRAAAANRNNEIMSSGPESLDPFADICPGRVRLDAVKQNWFKAASAQRFERALHRIEILQSGVGHDQRTARAQFPGDGSELRNPAIAETHRGGKAPVAGYGFGAECHEDCLVARRQEVG